MSGIYNLYKDTSSFEDNFERMLLAGVIRLSDVLPADWVEENVIMGQPFPGPYRYSKTPYCRAIINTLSPYHKAQIIAIMKGAQLGISAGVLIPGIGWIIAESPGNTYFTVGAPDLINKSVEKLDLMIDNANLRHHIKPQVLRNKNQKSGDTNTKKDFTDGFINITTPNNHKEWRDVSLRYGLIDDFESAKSASKESGNTRKLIEQRFAAYKDTRKIIYCSTPELKRSSNIEPVYLLGDQQKFMIPCECCGCAIELKWATQGKGKDFNGGMKWEVDHRGKLINSSVGYICQECGGFFSDKKKHKFLNDGEWMPTADPHSPEYTSFHISSLYAPLGMYDWAHYINNWLEIHPVGQPRKESLYKTFVTVVLGETYEEEAESPKATSIMSNQRDYEIGTIPENMSIADGNGNIIMLTCGADLNGVKDDGRLDYEILAHSETGSVYSISHGSVGTFIPREGSLKTKTDRQAWTYEANMEFSIFPEFEKLLGQTFLTDTGREMSIMITALDVGHYTEYAYTFIESSNMHIVAVKGEDEDRYVRFGIDKANVKQGLRKSYLYMLQVGLIKDQLSEYMQLRWRAGSMDQPPNFMNFPTPSAGLYGYNNYFSHFEAEHRIVDKNAEDEGTAARWVKRDSTVQNHLWDCRIYNLAARDIMLLKIGKELKKKVTWPEFIRMIKGE